MALVLPPPDTGNRGSGKLLPAGAVDGPLFDGASPALVALEGGLTRAHADISCRIPRGFDADGFIDAVREHAAGGEITVIEHVPAVRTGAAHPWCGPSPTPCAGGPATCRSR